MSEIHIKAKSTVAVGLSGGVDSALAAALLKEEGYQVFGLTMKIWDGALEIQKANGHACFGPDEVEDIRLSQEVCDQLEIPYHVFDLSEEYAETVLEYFRTEYMDGRTPNPCVVCNSRLKFGFLIDAARKSGLEFDYFATGHYARKEKIAGEWNLMRAKNRRKDQSYFLNMLPKEQLSDILFPLGDYTKEETRAMARKLNLAVAEREESQDFISGGDYSPLFDQQETQPGDIVDTKGNVLGKHRGIIFYTVGQRKGLNLNSPTPWYVLKIDASKNQIIVTDNEGLFSEGLEAIQVNYLGCDSFQEGQAVQVKIRKTQEDVPAQVWPTDSGFSLRFETPQRAVTPGQFVVVYEGEKVLAGGIIKESV